MALREVGPRRAPNENQTKAGIVVPE